ncbi:MAG: hypothetical protein AMXMBFR80_16530 [Dehalococcoidia bacterium]
MSDTGNHPDDALLERLQEAASGDAAVRQLRRRYDLLREDYERLLDRLGELEDRLNEAAERATQPAPATTFSSGLADAIAAPLLRLRDDYLAAIASIQSVVTGLEGLASGFKGQHTAAGRPEPQAFPAETPEPAQQPPPSARPARIHLDVKGSGFGELLDFQERLSQLGGVARVSINAIDNERATLVVELKAPSR